MTSKQKLIFATTSPRRLDLASKLPYNISFQKPLFDEQSRPHLGHEAPEIYALDLAREKARSIFQNKDHAATPILGFDTIVVCENIPLGKPGTYDEAFSMIQRLQGNWHRVCTAISILHNNTETSHIEITHVHIASMNDRDIHTFLERESWHDKAGGYGIQSEGSFIIDQIRGCYYNVMGLPLYALSQKLKALFQ